MSHSYMIHDVIRDPPRSAHQKILEEDQTRKDHVVVVLLKCRCITEIGQMGINIRLFHMALRPWTL